MSNIHRIGDYDLGANNNNNNNSRANPRSTLPASSNIFMMGNNDDGDGGSMYPPISKVLAPNYTSKSFIFIISMIQIILFIFELIIGGWFEDGAFVEGNDMAGPSSATLKLMGGKYLPCIQNGEIYRFLTPALLHAGILHIFTNLVSQTMIGYTCELHWGTYKMALFYFGVK